MKQKKTKKNAGKRVWFSLVFLVLGFILAFSYRMLGAKNEEVTYRSTVILQEEKYREELIEQQERNKELAEEIATKQEKIRQAEQSFSLGERDYKVLAEEATDLRLLLGIVPAVGQGVKVTLKDGDYDPTEQNPNDYIVHESHVLRVVNELRISGAQGIVINGQRVNSNSHIKCTGPVITIDGRTFPAPFVIEAVGDAEVLEAALKLKGGVVDSLLRDHIVVDLEQVKSIKLPALRNDQY